MSIFLKHFDGELDYCHVLITDETLPGKFGKLINRSVRPGRGTLLEVLRWAFDYHRDQLAALGIRATPINSVIVCVEQNSRIFSIKDFNRKHMFIK